MSKLFFSHAEFIDEHPQLPGKDHSHVHFHFRPARPANFCITLDPDTGEVNCMAGTIGPLTWRPYTMCLHIDRENSVDSYRNLQRTDECVIALPGKDIVAQTWMTQLHVPRGINELEVARLTPFESKWVRPPSIKECKVNFECKIEFFKDYYSHAIVFVRVIGASIDEEILDWSREQVVSLYPTYEVDDISNPDVDGRSSVERLGVMGEIYECPRFPVGPKRGWGGTFETWLTDLKEEAYISLAEYNQIIQLSKEWQQLFFDSYSIRREEVKKQITEISTMLAWEEWDHLHSYLASLA